LYPYISTTPTSTATPPTEATPFPYSPAGGAPGGNPSLWDVLVTGSLTVTNMGPLPGKEVVQIYVTYPPTAGEPPGQLRGFEKVSLDVGESTTVDFDLLRKDLSFWDVGSQNWVLPQGTFEVFVGSSSRNLVLQQSFTVA
jgi:beta-glucosidase